MNYSARLDRDFFAGDARRVARELLGMILVRMLPDGLRLSGRIVETEAYRPGDVASHAHRGPTARNAPMYMRPGTAYVYLIYGMHCCFNAVAEPEAVPAAVLVRALEPLDGIERIAHNRRAGTTRQPALHDLCRGPARLCQGLQIDRAFSGYDLCASDAALFIEWGTPVPDADVCTSPRIGVGGDATARTIPWRWYIAPPLG